MCNTLNKFIHTEREPTTVGSLLIIVCNSAKRNRTADLLNAIVDGIKKAKNIYNFSKKEKPRHPLDAKVFIGGDKRDRTADLLNAIQSTVFMSKNLPKSTINH